MWNIDEDIIQRIKVAGIFLLQSYKIVTGTMMSLFIPQSCGDNICTINENYENSNVYHKTVFYWNSLSMFMFFGYYLMELRREEFAIKYLDINNDLPDNHLKHIIVKRPQLDRRMDIMNKRYYYILCANGIVYFINLGLTGKMIQENYHSNSTLSCFASFSLLVLMKLYNSFIVANESIKNDKMMSAYMSEFVSFNVLDADYVDKHNLQFDEHGELIEEDTLIEQDDLIEEDKLIEITNKDEDINVNQSVELILPEDIVITTND
jgi:hypothetical protein